MRNFNLLDTNSFRPFYFAAETLNFTLAAEKVGLTQSGVSQHIAKLEHQLGVPLFVRVNRRVVLTEAGKRLKTYIEKFADDVEVLREEIAHEVTLLQGLVSYAMPASCLMSPHFPLLLDERNKSFPGVELRVSLCPSEEVIAKLLNVEIDFGFVTKHTQDPQVVFSPFCPEEYILIAGNKRDATILQKDLHTVRFLKHPGVEVLFDYWIQHHFPKAKNITWDSLNVVGEINSLPGVIEMVSAGMGVTIIPRHCVMGPLAKKSVFEFKADRKDALLQQIYIVTLAGQSIPRRVQKVIDTFFEMKK